MEIVFRDRGAAFLITERIRFLERRVIQKEKYLKFDDIPLRIAHFGLLPVRSGCKMMRTMESCNRDLALCQYLDEINVFLRPRAQLDRFQDFIRFGNLGI